MNGPKNFFHTETERKREDRRERVAGREGGEGGEGEGGREEGRVGYRKDNFKSEMKNGVSETHVVSP